MSKETESCEHIAIVAVHEVNPRTLVFVVRENKHCEGDDWEYFVRPVKCARCGADGIEIVDNQTGETVCVEFPNWPDLPILQRIGVAYLVRDLSVCDAPGVGGFSIKDHIEIALNQIMRDADTSPDE